MALTPNFQISRPGPAGVPHPHRGGSKPVAAATIYPAVLAAWTYLAFHGQPGPVVSAAVFVAGFVGILLYDFWLRRRARQYASNRPALDRPTP
jgi:Flp pilus assembly protein TadB